MKHLPLAFALLMSSVCLAQKNHSCCNISATEAFAQLSGDSEFISGHANPLPYVYQGKAGEMITFSTPEGKQAHGFLLKSEEPSDKYLFVFQEWWGLNDHIKREAEKYYSDLKNINVLALDLYDGKVATSREEASQLVRAATPERMNNIIQGAINHVGKKAKIATIGWCFGGSQSLNAALLAGKQAVGCVIFYGMPEKDINRLKKLNCDVLGIFAGKEEHISPQVVAQFEKDMKEAGKKLTVKSYNAVHAFANPSNPQFDQVAAADAYQLAFKYLKERLK